MRMLALLMLVTALAPSAAAQDFDPITYRAEELADGLVLLRGAGGNVLARAGDDRTSERRGCGGKEAAEHRAKHEGRLLGRVRNRHR